MHINVYVLKSNDGTPYAVNLKAVGTGKRRFDDAQANGEYVGRFTTMRGYARIVKKLGLALNEVTQQVNTFYNGKESLNDIL